MKAKKGLQNWLDSTIKTGDTFYIQGSEDCYSALGMRGKNMICSTKSKNHEDRFEISINNPNIYKKECDYMGVNPFHDTVIRFTAFGLDSIFSMIGYDRRAKKNEDGKDMPYFNWNPYFIRNGEKVHYQRGYVWTLKQKKALIRTIYNNLEAGRIIVHAHDWKKQENMIKAGYTDFASRDIVDGKQRLSTIIEFIEDKFTDDMGYYYSDLSKNAQRKFGEYQGILYGEMDSNSSDEQICDAFLNNAVAGTPISKEHIEFIKKFKAELLNDEIQL